MKTYSLKDLGYLALILSIAIFGARNFYWKTNDTLLYVAIALMVAGLATIVVGLFKRHQ